jgi:hypothetical protein
MRDRSTLLRIEHLWVALPFCFVLWAGFHAPVRLSDFWCYLKLGEVIAQARQIPRVDLFSFTAAGEPFVSQNWLAALLYHLTHAGAGLEGVVALNALILVVALGFSFASALGEAPSLRSAAAGSAFAAAGLIFQRNMRPQTFSFLFFALVLWIVLRLRRGERVGLWLAPVATAVWVNLHGGFVLGLALLVLGICGEWIERRRLSRPMLATLLLMAAATLCNPEGVGIYRGVYEVATDVSSQRFVQEWLAPSIRELHSVLAFFVPVAAVILVLALSRRRPAAMELLLLVAFGLFAATARRNAIWFSLVAAPIVSSHIATLPFRTASTVGSAAANRAIVAALALITVLLSPWVYPRLGRTELGLSLLDRRTPVRGIDYMQRAGIEGRIFHPQEYGDYLMWRLWPRQRTFIDSRVHLFDDEVIRAYIQVGRGVPGWESILARYEIRWILLSPVDPEHATLIRLVRESGTWSVAYNDGQTILFGRKERP